MNKSELIESISKTTGLARREAENAVNAVVHTVVSEVKAGRRVAVVGFGSFNPTRRSARKGRNPQTGEPVRVAASKGVRFAASSTFKKVVNGKAPLAPPKLSGTGVPAATTTRATRASAAKGAPAKATAAKGAAAKRAPAKATAAKGAAAKATASSRLTKAASSVKAGRAVKAPAKQASAAKVPAKRAAASPTGKVAATRKAVAAKKR